MHPDLSNDLEKNIQKYQQDIKYRAKTIALGCFLIIIAFLSGYSFYSVARSNINAYWMHGLNLSGRMYYCLFLGLTWYHSLSLLGMAISSGFVIYWTIKSDKIIFIDDDFAKNDSIIAAVDIIFTTFSYGLFYIIGAFLFIFNDRVSIHYKVYNTFSNDLFSFLLVFIVIFLVVIAFMPLQELFVFMKNKKNTLIDFINKEIHNEKKNKYREHLITKRNNLIKQNLIDTSVTNKITFILSILIPLMGVIFQGIELFAK